MFFFHPTYHDFHHRFLSDWGYFNHPLLLRRDLCAENSIEQLIGQVAAYSNAASDHAATYRIDSYLITGMGAVNLVMIPVLLTMGAGDIPLEAISKPDTGC